MALSPLLQPVSFEALPGWRQDDKSSAFEAFRRSARQVVAKPYRSGALGIDFAAFAEAYEAARLASPSTAADARAFFEAHFVPMRVQSDKRHDKGWSPASMSPRPKHRRSAPPGSRSPLLSRPADLVDVDDDNRPAGLDPYLAFGRAADAGIVEYFDRAGDRAGRACGQRSGDRLARGQGRRVLHPCPGRCPAET